MSKRYSIFLTALFCAFLGGMALLSLLLPKKSFSELENRYLQKAPTLSFSSVVVNGKFMEEAEDYVSDHIAGRDFWVALKAWSERLSGKRENEGVYFGKENTLLNQVSAPDETQLGQAMDFLNLLAEQSPVPTYFGVIPTSAAIWQDRLPEGAPTADEESVIRELAGESRAQTVDIYGALAVHAEEDIYYRTDHHWTSLGAFYGANAILSAMGREPLDLADYTPITVSDSFYGTIFSTSGVRWVPPDSIEAYVTEDGVSVTSYPKGEPEPGKLYDASYLTKKNQYAYFLGGNQPLCVVRSGKPGAEGKLLLVRDSYADSLTPFLTERFREIHLIDLRYYRASLQDYIRENGIDEIMVLYGYSNFTTDRNLFLLAK